MEAFILNENGDTENLQKTNVSEPRVEDDEVLIKTKAIGINPIDAQVRGSRDMLNMISDGNIPDPVILGWDVAGTVEKTGKGVTEFKERDLVMGLINMPGLGQTYAEYVVAKARHLAIKPSNITLEHAAAVPMAALTAWQAVVTLGETKKNDRILIHAASGGVGHFAVQIAKYFGACVAGTSSGKNEDFVKGLGVDKFIDYKAAPFEESVEEMDIVVDSINAIDHVLKSIKVIKTGGRLVYLQPHFQEGLEAKMDENGIKGESVFVNSSGEILQKIASLIEKGQIRPHISKTFPFDQLPEAHAAIETGRTIGKIIVRF